MPYGATVADLTTPSIINDEVSKENAQTGSNLSSTLAPPEEEKKEEPPNTEETTPNSADFTDITKADLTFSTAMTENYSTLITVESIENLTAITVEPETTNYDCGMGPFKYLNADEQRRIVGGSLAIRNSWPFLVGSSNLNFPN